MNDDQKEQFQELIHEYLKENLVVHLSKGYNPWCGDSITVEVVLDGKVITKDSLSL